MKLHSLVPLLGFLACPALASEKLEVVSMDLGSCWLRQEPAVAAQTGETDATPFQWKIASFNDGANFFFVPDSNLPAERTLETQLAAKLKPVFQKFGPSRYRVDLHCGGAGHQILISIYEGAHPVCAWAKKSADSNFGLAVQDVFPNPEAKPDSPCYGVTPKKLLIRLDDRSPGGSIASYFRGNARYRDVVESAEFLSVVGYIVLELKTPYGFREKDAKSLVEKDAFLKGKIKSVLYDHNALIVGEDFLIHEGSYPGF